MGHEHIQHRDNAPTSTGHCSRYPTQPPLPTACSVARGRVISLPLIKRGIEPGRSKLFEAAARAARGHCPPASRATTGFDSACLVSVVTKLTRSTRPVDIVDHWVCAPTFLECTERRMTHSTRGVGESLMPCPRAEITCQSGPDNGIKTRRRSPRHSDTCRVWSAAAAIRNETMTADPMKRL